MLWPPAAASSSARRPSGCPRTSARSGASAGGGARAGAAGGISRSPRSQATASVRCPRRAPPRPRAGPPRPRGARADHRLETGAPRRLGREQRSRDRTQPPIERELAEHEHPPARSGGTWSVAARIATAIARSKRDPSLGSVARRQADRRRGAAGTRARPRRCPSAPARAPPSRHDRAARRSMVGPCSRPLTWASTSTGTPSTPIAVLAVGGGEHEDEARPDQCYGTLTGANASAPAAQLRIVPLGSDDCRGRRQTPPESTCHSVRCLAVVQPPTRIAPTAPSCALPELKLTPGLVQSDWREMTCGARR